MDPELDPDPEGLKPPDPGGQNPPDPAPEDSNLGYTLCCIDYASFLQAIFFQ
jgi:hypothetical protein